MLDEAEGSSATATEEWYETERLTGQITGGRSAPAVDQPAPHGAKRSLSSIGATRSSCAGADRASAAWPESRGSLPPRRVVVRRSQVIAAIELAAADGRDPDASAHKQARRPRLTMLTTRRVVAPPTVESREDRPTADEVLAAEPSSPTNRSARPPIRPQLLDWRSAPAPKARRDRRPRPSRRALVGAALVLTAAAVAVIAITSHTEWPRR